MIGISHSSEKRAIIDIGSNTVRLVIYNGPPRAPVVVLNEKVNARLGKDLGKTGAISDKSMRTALYALERFATVLRLQGVENVQCVATAAARDASNGQEFLEAVRGYGLSPQLLSGEEEARASASGVIAAFPGAHGVVADLGGGSLELVEVDRGTSGSGITLPFGTLRLSDLRANGPEAFARTVREGLERVAWDKGGDQPLYIVGGAWRALGLQAMRELNWPVDDPHGFELPAAEVLRLTRQFSRGRIENPDPRISNARLGTLPDAAALMTEVVTQLRPSHLVFSSWGLREGLLHTQLTPDVQVQDPMLASIAGFALGERVTAQDARSVYDWTAGACDEDPAEGKLRLAATLLALAAMRTEPNLRTEEAMTWALRKRWIGLDMHGRGMLAMTVFANSGLTEIPEQFSRLAQQSHLDRAIAWGLAVRLCRRLHGGSAKALTWTALARDAERLTLTLSEPALPLFANSTTKDLRMLAEWLGLDWCVLGPDGAPIPN
ncbi:Ppx/GppA family phosphatase [Novosphingobium mangrovi (ex Huang et al. 2023)]|uniref:Ppx/GppA family phosphatase n=1 Tax=Novosphingobium mangrovi (ex Huang et al. 2023) TaxID=2976432 RepID=A0ABT2I622_9SPHN|nr:Ppx/GppA family phosphatase [Novosphingobium mangrovi (ex Huang et al. 2023)]MCT2400254.1 Ppx/GppA family phosphatase [Novosphingobium mangrovi (ex Huang et al. 2023)]